MNNTTSIWRTRGRSAILAIDNQQDVWLTYLQLIGGVGQVVMRQVQTGNTLTVSDNEVDCTSLTTAAYQDGVMIIWSQFVEGSYQLFEGDISGSSPRQVTDERSSVINPALVMDASGVPCLVYQTSDKQGEFNIYMRRKVNDQWMEPLLISDTPGGNWCPAITCCSDGKLAIAWDGYGTGSYDIYLRFIHPGMVLGSTIRLTSDDLFHAHVDLSPAPNGDVWIAWNRGTSQWGKDNEVYRRTRISDRNYLHTRRFLEVRRASPSQCLPVYPPVQDYLDHTLPGLLHERPRLYSSPDGPLYLAFRYNKGELRGGHRNEKRWQAMVTCYDGRHWHECIELNEAYGLSTGYIDLLPSADKVMASAAGEGGERTTKELNTHVNLYELQPLASDLKLEDPPIAMPLYSLPTGIPNPKTHFINHKGKQYKLYFGDLHRHTELSFCRTSIDGSLEEAFRATKDAEALDFAMTADHDHQEKAPDMWAQTMQAADRFYIPKHFTTFFGYEWIGAPKNRRHRNIVSTERVPPPPQVNIEPSSSEYRDVKKTWSTLQRGKSITIPHHTACRMSLLWGKDPGEGWDPEYQPLVEIFQASRASSEYLNCPTLCNAFYTSEQHLSATAFDVEGGFVSDALQQGLRMGFIASSDHMSTHRSYACLYAQENTREGLMEAMLARRAYAATDRILCEFSIGDAIMGEETTIEDTFVVRIWFVGTDTIKEVTLLRDSVPYHTWTPSSTEVEIVTQLNPNEARGHYYYARMIQHDSNMAWASPIWVS